MESMVPVWLFFVVAAFVIGLLLDERMPGWVPAGLLVTGVFLFWTGADSYNDDGDFGPYLYVGVFSGMAVIFVGALCGGLAISSAWRRRRSHEG